MTRFHSRNQWNYKWLPSRSVKSFAAAAGFALLTACTTAPQPRPVPPQGPAAQLPPQLPQAETPREVETPDQPAEDVKDISEAAPAPRNGLTPPHMAGRNIRRMAIILPFSSQNSQLRNEADSLLKAAQIAIFNQDTADNLLMPFDSKGTKTGTRTAVQQAVDAGADVIIGPILSASVREARAHAKDVPVIGFSTDQRAAGNGAYLLSFPPEAEINRIVAHARTNGISRFAFLGPDNAYGRRVRQAYGRAVEASGGEITAVETYKGRDIAAMQGPAQRLAQSFAQTEETRGELDPMAFEAIILPESGIALRTLAPLLTFYEDDLRKVQFLGTGQWQDEDAAREPALNGGVFAGPEIEERQRFQAGYDQIYGTDPGRLASLAYDAVNIAQFVAGGDPKTRKSRLEDKAGFYGIDGLIRFRPDGTPDRGLAVYEIRNGRIRVIEPAPRQTNEPS